MRAHYFQAQKVNFRGAFSCSCFQQLVLKKKTEKNQRTSDSEVPNTMCWSQRRRKQDAVLYSQFLFLCVLLRRLLKRLMAGRRPIDWNMSRGWMQRVWPSCILYFSDIWNQGHQITASSVQCVLYCFEPKFMSNASINPSSNKPWWNFDCKDPCFWTLVSGENPQRHRKYANLLFI